MAPEHQFQTTLRRNTWIVLVCLTLLLVVEIAVSIGRGFLQIPFADILQAVAARLSGGPGSISTADQLAPVVIMDVRLPRILTAALVGAGLAVSGAVFQAILLNPLADPYTLGVSAGAAFGASLALLLNITFLGIWSVPSFAFGGAVMTLMVVIYLTAGSGEFSSGSLILSGIIVAAILSAGVSFIKYLADEQVGIIIFWLMGSFASMTWTQVGIASAATGLGVLVCFFFSRELNLLTLGSRAAGTLGISPRRISLLLLITASLVSAVCVAVSGIIGFVGLLVPHMVRFVTGPDNRRLIPMAAVCGACLLLCADTVTRTVLPREIPIGVITAMIGGPFFCVIYRRRQIRPGG